MYVRISHIVSKIPLYHLDSLFPLQNELNFIIASSILLLFADLSLFFGIKSRLACSFSIKMEKFRHSQKTRKINSSAMSQTFYIWRFILIIWSFISKRPIKFLLLDTTIAVEMLLLLGLVEDIHYYTVYECIFLCEQECWWLSSYCLFTHNFYCHFILFHLFVCGSF
jgi:hypothetical protein